MAIYRFETIFGSRCVSDSMRLREISGDFSANEMHVTEKTFRRLLAELEANEAAAGGLDDGWKPASEPPGSMRDVVVQLHSGKTGIGYFTSRWFVYQVDTGSISATDVSLWHELPKPPSLPLPQPPKEPEPVWQGPGWYEVLKSLSPFFVTRSSDAKYPLRGTEGQDWYLDDVTRLIRLATDDELRHVCTHGTEPDSRPEVW